MDAAIGLLNFSGRRSLLVSIRGLKRWKEPRSYDEVEFPTERKLPILPNQPVYPHGVRQFKMMKRLETIRGPETVDNTLLYKQYGIMALCGGFIRPGHINMIRLTINKKLDVNRMFAVWRIEPPWKPITKKGQGKRMGKGKGSIDHYVTPVKAGRVIIEVGGKIEMEEVQPLLQEICYKMPVDAIPVTEEILAKIEEEYEEEQRKNVNPFSMERVIDYKMHGSSVWTGRWDRLHKGRYI